MPSVGIFLCKLLSSSNIVGEHGKKRHLGGIAGELTFTVQGLEVVKTNMATYRMQVAETFDGPNG